MQMRGINECLKKIKVGECMQKKNTHGIKEKLKENICFL